MGNDQSAGACSLTSALDDLDLIAAIDGEAHPDVLKHLQACSNCTARAREFAALQRLLREHLYRAFCPPSATLADFQQGLLGGAQRVLIARHIAECPHCARELWLLTDALKTPLVGRRVRTTSA